MGGQPGLDYAEIFAATLTPYVVLSPDFVIRDANRAYLRATGRTLEELIGRPLFEAFPRNPDDPQADGVETLRASLERVLETGQPDAMAIQQYDIPDGDGFAQRFWSPVTIPILDDRGDPALLLHRVEDVTEYVRARKQAAPAAAFPRPVEHAEADIFARAQELQELNRRLREAGEREREIAVTLQRAMLRDVPPLSAGTEVAVRYRPADDALHVGGDWYDVVALPDHRVALAVGDVVGKGLEAAAVMGQLRSALTAATYSTEGPPEALDVLDAYARSLHGSAGTTVVQVCHDVRAATLRYSRAGHLPPLVLWPDAQAEYLFDAGAPPLGADLIAVARPRGDVPFPPGSTVVLYTDGLVERRGRSVDDGLAALAALVRRHVALDVEALADAILADISADRPARDDTALVVARST